MESKEEVHSDGSYELVNFDDYASETESLDAEGVDSGSKGLSDASSYDLLCSDISDTLVLTEDEDFYNTTVSQENTIDEEDEENEEQEQVNEEHMGVGNGISSDSEMQPVFVSANKGKKRDLMAMLYMSSNPDPFVPPAQLKTKHDIKEVAKNHITRYLPAKALLKCRKVSKEWNQWISGPFCAHEQSQFFRKTSGFFQYSSYKDISFISLEKSAYGVPYPSLSFLPQQVSIKSSCNGLLLCQASNNEEELYVCNPANTEFVFLPLSQSYHGRNPKFVLAFEPSSLNFEPRYQVICLFSLLDAEEKRIVYFDIYDSETKVWRLSEELCLDYDASEVESESIFVNGVAYWETKDGGLLAFDLKNEIYSVQKLPFYKSGALTNIRGEICYVRARYESYRKSCVLEIYGDGFMSLKKSVIVPDDEYENAEYLDCEVFANSCDDVMALGVKGSWGQNRLYVYHVKEEKAQRVGVLDSFEKLFPYVNSLVSIRGSG